MRSILAQASMARNTIWSFPMNSSWTVGLFGQATILTLKLSILTTGLQVTTSGTILMQVCAAV